MYLCVTGIDFVSVSANFQIGLCNCSDGVCSFPSIFHPMKSCPQLGNWCLRLGTTPSFPLFKHIDLIIFVTSLKHLMFPPYRISPFHIRYHHSTCAITIPHALSPFHMPYHHSACAITIPHAQLKSRLKE
jgi:hypothetical protein